jgi:hypothetical protein
MVQQDHKGHRAIRVLPALLEQMAQLALPVLLARKAK